MRISESQLAQRILFIAPTLVGLPYLLERLLPITAGVLQVAISMALLLILFFAAVARFGRVLNGLRRVGLLVVLYFFVYAVAMLRVHGSDNWSLASEIRSYLAFAGVLAAIVLVCAFQSDEEMSLMKAGRSFCDGLIFFVGVNVALALLGFYVEKEEQMVMLAYFGIEAPRRIMLMSPGANSFGLVCGMLLAVSGPLLRGRHYSRALLAAGVATVGLLLTDMRAGFLVGVLSAFFVMVAPRLVPLVLKFSVLAPVVVALLIVTFGSDVSDQTFSVVRDEDSSGGRLMLWALAMNGWVESAERIVWGMGRMGQYESGYYFPKLFGAEGDAALIPVHNQYLQVAVDAGVVGVLILAGMFFAFASRVRWSSATKEGALPVSAAVLYLEWISTTEVPLVPVHPFFFVSLLPLVVGLLHGRSRTRSMS